MWEMAAASLHNDVFLDSEERHERASHCASVCDDTFVLSSASARGLEMATGIVWSGMPRMSVEEAHCGDLAGDGQIQLPWNQR